MTERDNALKRDDNNDVAIVIPTCGGVQLVECFARVLVNSGNNTKVVVSLNPMDSDLADQTKSLCQQLAENVDIDVAWVEADRPLGFGGAVNAGIDHLKESGFPETIIVLNDDTRPSPDWVDGIKETFDTQFFATSYDTSTKVQTYDIKKYPKVGIVGPASNAVIRGQLVKVKGLPEDQIDSFAADFKRQNEKNFLSTNFISGFCMAFSRDLIADLIGKDGYVFDPVFNERIGGFEDNDVCLRAQHMGYGLMIAGQTYVHHNGHQTIGNLNVLNGLANYPVFLKRWEEYTQRDQTLGAAFRVKIETANDLFVFKEALKRAANVCDSISVLFTANPSDLVNSPDYPTLQHHLDAGDIELLNTCSVCDVEGIGNAGGDWIKNVVKHSWHGDEGSIACDVWAGEFNERDERNQVLSMANDFDSDWIISIDHDEIIEARVDRQYFERLMKNPNPEVFAYDFSWINHWNSPDYIRVDSPWGDDGAYDGSMRGTRMYRNFSKDRLILGGTDIGLHCGNIPGCDMYNVRTANMRFHHFGYMRGIDRVRKYQNYVKIDTTTDPQMLGTKEGHLPYQHLVDEVNMTLSPTPKQCGIAFTGLAYEGESVSDFIRVLENIYALMDQICMVWTDTTIKTPSEEWEYVGNLYGVDWVVETFNDDLSKCRNAGLERLRETVGENVGWVLSLDLDEHFSNYLKESTMMRRMAESPKPVSWIFTFVNNIGVFNGESRASESTTHRMFRIDPKFGLKWEGKVHEGLSRSIFRLREEGFPAQFAKAPFKLLHVGLNKSPEEIHNKLEKYGKMLYDECNENPNEAMPWISLGLHFLNDGRNEEAITCFNYAIAIDGPESWMAHKELGSYYLRLAKSSFGLSHSKLDDKHDMYAWLQSMNEGLSGVSVDYPFIGRAKEGRFFQSEINALPDAIPDNVRLILEQHLPQGENEPESGDPSLNKSTQEVSLSNGSKV